MRQLFALAVLAITLLVVPSASAAAATRSPDRQLAAWIKQVTATKAPARIKGVKSKVKIPAKLRRALPALTRKATKLARKVDAVDVNSLRKSSKDPFLGMARTAGAADGVAFQIEMPSPKEVVGGVELSATATMTKYENGTLDAQFQIDAEANGYTLRFKPMLDLNHNGIPHVECPTAEGRLEIADSAVEGGTMMVLKGRSVIVSRTIKMTTTTKAVGQVGRDAKLANVKAAMSRKLEHYERGLQVVTLVDRDYSVPREGAPVGGKPHVKVTIKAAQASRAEIKAAEKSYSQQQANGETANLAPRADLARWRMVKDEYKWYQLPNYCARASLDPNSIQLGEGESKTTRGTVRAKDGGESAGSFEVASVGRGSFTVTKSAVDPGAPAQFTATGAAPDDAGSTVDAQVIATSHAGRAQATFYGEGVPVNVPKSFGGWVESTTTGDGLKYHFDAMLEFERTYVNTGPNGFATAWYELTRISAEHESYNELGAAGGCRWVAKAPSGNQINSGDVELRRASTNAPWTYAIQVDLSIPDQQFIPTDCPPGAEPPAFTGDIVNQLYTAPTGNFRQIWSGSTENDMRLIELDPVSDVRGPGEFPTAAKWGLIGS